jgi:hypothetical protein
MRRIWWLLLAVNVAAVLTDTVELLAHHVVWLYPAMVVSIASGLGCVRLLLRAPTLVATPTMADRIEQQDGEQR